MAKRRSKRSRRGKRAWTTSTGPTDSWSPIRVFSIAASGVALVGYLAVLYLLVPDELPLLLQWFLGLVTAGLAILVFVLAAPHPESTEMAARLARAQELEFGTPLYAYKRGGTVNLPLLGEMSIRVAGSVAVLLVTAVWWLSPWAPVAVAVHTATAEDLAGPLAEGIVAVVLVVPDGDLPVPHPPFCPPRARKLVKRLPGDADEYLLGLRAIIEGQFSDAAKLLQQALNAPQTTEVTKADIYVALAQAEMYSGWFVQALKWYQEALESKPDDPTILCQAAAAQMHVGDYEEAEKLVARATEICRENPSQDNRPLAASLHLEAALCTLRGEQYEKAENSNEGARGIWSNALGREHPLVAASVNNQAVLFHLRAIYPGAENLNTLAHKMWRRTLNDGHPYLAASRGNLAMLQYVEGRYDIARKHHHEAANMRDELVGKEILPPNHPAIVIGRHSTAVLQLARGRYADGLAGVEQVLAGLEDSPAARRPHAVAILNTAAALHAAMAHYGVAEQHCLRAVALAESELGAEHPYLATSLSNLANLYLAQDRYDEAEAKARQALEISREVLGEDHPNVARDLGVLGRVAFERENVADARTHLQNALEIRQKLLEEHPEVARIMGDLAGLDSSPRRYVAGVLLYQKAIEMDQRLLGEDHPSVAQLLFGLASLHMQRGRHADAEGPLERCLGIRESKLDPFHPDLADALELQADVLRSADPAANKQQAADLERRAKDIRRQHAEAERPQS